MKNKFIIAGISAVLLVGGVYVGGVYYTGVVVHKHCAEIGGSIAKKPQLQSVVPGLSLEYSRLNNSLFSESGKIVISFPSEDGKTQNIEIPININNGFFNSTISLNPDNFNLDVDLDNFELDKNSQKLNMLFNISVLSKTLDIAGDFTANYENSSFGVFTAKLNSKIDSNENINTELKFLNLKNSEGSLDSLDITTRMQGLNEIKDVGDSKIVVEGFNAGLNSFKTMTFTSKAVNKDKNGKFDLNLTLSGDNLAGYAYDYNIDVVLSSLNVNDFNHYYAKDMKNATSLVSNLKHLDINKLDCRLAPIIGAFVGIPELDKVKLSSYGKFDWDVKLGLDSVSGSLTVNADTNKNLERFMVEKDGKYQAVIKLEKNRLFVNDMPYM